MLNHIVRISFIFLFDLHEKCVILLFLTCFNIYSFQDKRIKFLTNEKSFT